MYYLNLINLFDEDEFQALLDAYWSQVFVLNNDYNVVFAAKDRDTLVALLQFVSGLASYKDLEPDFDSITETL